MCCHGNYLWVQFREVPDGEDAGLAHYLGHVSNTVEVTAEYLLQWRRGIE